MLRYLFLTTFVACLALMPGRTQTPERDWVRTYSLIADKTNRAARIRVTTEGDVLVAGSSLNGSNNSDYVLIKYGATGDQRWLFRYDSEDNDDFRAMTVMDSGDTLLTGSSHTLRVASSGTPTWTNALSGRDIKHQEATVCIAGFSDVDHSLASLDNTSGITLWTQMRNGPSNSIDFSQKVTIGASGEIYTAGMETDTCTPSLGTCAQHVRILKYSAAGDFKWAAQTGLRLGAEQQSKVEALTVDPAGSVLVLYNENPMDFRCMRFTSGGAEDFGPDNGVGVGPNGEGMGRGMLVDSTRIIYLTGREGLSGDVKQVNTAATTVKLNVDGTIAWRRDYPPSNVGRNEALDIAKDGMGNIYIAGYVTNQATGTDILVIKYTNTGEQLWVDILDGPAHGNDVATGVAVDTFGNVYVAGYQETVQRGSEFLTIKYLAAPKIEKQPSGMMRLEFHTTPGQQYALEASSDFLDWESLTTNTADANGVVRFDDTGAPLIPYRFYRGNSAP